MSAVFNVKHPDYGAVGDGVTDDRAAIQSAHKRARHVKDTTGRIHPKRTDVREVLHAVARWLHRRMGRDE